MTKKLHLMCLLAAFVFGAVCASSAAEDKKKTKKETEEEKEIREAAEEDKQEADTSGIAFRPHTFKGRLLLNPIGENETSNTVVGIFETPQGSYLLKFDNMTLRKELLADNGKQVALCGKIRNQGKYFVVMNAFKEAPKTAPPLSKIGGL